MKITIKNIIIFSHKNMPFSFPLSWREKLSMPFPMVKDRLASTGMEIIKNRKAENLIIKTI